MDIQFKTRAYQLFDRLALDPIRIGERNVHGFVKVVSLFKVHFYATERSRHGKPPFRGLELGLHVAEPLSSDFMQFFLDYLDSVAPNWCHGCGSFGCFTVDIVNRSIHFEYNKMAVHQAYTEKILDDCSVGSAS
jgi:hypothetical protein